MKYTDFEKFFEQHIEKFLPFRDQITYQELVTFLKDVYFKDSYTIIPENFKSLLEEQTIPAEMYSPILLSLGFSEDIVNNCSSIQREILLKNFGDYNRYKGSRHVLNTIFANFEQRINIYELFVDSRSSDWYFIPSLIYSNPEVTALSDVLDYTEIADQAKHFLITKSQLTLLQSAEKIVLPIKSNILYLQAESNLYIGYIENIIFTTVFHNYYNDSLFYYNDDDIFITSLLGLFQLWEYLIMRQTNNAGFPAIGETETADIEFFKELIFLDSLSLLGLYPLWDSIPTISKTNLIFLDPGSDNDPTTTPYSLTSTDANYIDNTLITAFDDVSTIRERDLFFDTYIKNTPADSNKFYKVNYTADELTLADIEIMFQSASSPIGSDLFKYIDDRLDAAISMSREVDLILEELRSSFLIWVNSSSDTILTKYHNYLLRYLDATHPVMITESSIIYKLIDFLKPQHTEIVTNDISHTRVFDKFNALLLGDTFSTTVPIDEYISALSVSDDFYEFVVCIPTESYVISDDYKLTLLYHDSDLYTISDDTTTQHLDESVSAFPIFDDFILSKTYDGLFTFAASNIIQADAVGYAEFDVDDYIFSLSDTSDCALKITNKDLPTLQLTLENTYTGSTGLVAKAWKICTN